MSDNDIILLHDEDELFRRVAEDVMEWHQENGLGGLAWWFSSSGSPIMAANEWNPQENPKDLDMVIDRMINLGWELTFRLYEGYKGVIQVLLKKDARHLGDTTTSKGVSVCLSSLRALNDKEVVTEWI